MSHRQRWIIAAVLSLACVAGISPAWGVIERPLPLKQLAGDSDAIFAGQVTDLDASRPSMVVAVKSDLKGKSPVLRLPVLLKGTDGKGKDEIVPRLSTGSAVVGFITKPDDDGDANTLDPLIALLYFEGTWVQLQGTPAGDAYRWQYTHAEPYLRRTFAGRSSELADLVTNALAGKAAWPEVQTSVKPGLGPTIGETGNPFPTSSDSTSSGHSATAEHGGDASPATSTAPAETTPVTWPMALGMGAVAIGVLVGAGTWIVMSQKKENQPPSGK